MPTLFDGTVVDGRYRIERKLGSGGVGTVYLAEHLALGKLMAVKILHAHDDPLTRHYERLRREAEVMASIRAPNVARVFDYGTHEGAPYLAMEYLSGRNLGSQLQRDGWLPWPKVRDILSQTIHGLSAAYALGILHRDIKPSNVFLTTPHVGPDPTVKLLDFGLAKSLDTASPLGTPLTAADVVVGTVRYLAPERIDGEPASIRSEIYSLGLLAFECLCGRPPLTDSNPITLLRRRLREPPPSALTLVPGLPPAVDELLLRAMEREPTRRFGSLAEFEAALLAIPTHQVSSAAAREVDAVTPIAWCKTMPYGASSDGLVSRRTPTYPPTRPLAHRLPHWRPCRQ
ncbi:MAG: serine/threonine-protein kinase [Myxococcota bacterium]